MKIIGPYSLMVQFMRVQSLAVVATSCLLWLVSWILAPAALALTQIQLSNLSYHDCPEELAEGSVTSGGVTQAANCFIVSGKAENKSGKTVYDADIFGRIYDAGNNPVMQNRTRLGSIEEVPPGMSDFELRVSVPAALTTPLQLKQFKAAGFSGRVRR
ncbi:MAG: hypothetical protein NVS2B14_07890 [Chamaesiphon sp.]